MSGGFFAGGSDAEPVALVARIAADLPMALGEDSAIKEDYDAARTLLPGELERLLERGLIPSERAGVDGLPLALGWEIEIGRLCGVPGSDKRNGKENAVTVRGISERSLTQPSWQVLGRDRLFSAITSMAPD